MAKTIVQNSLACDEVGEAKGKYNEKNNYHNCFSSPIITQVSVNENLARPGAIKCKK